MLFNIVTIVFVAKLDNQPWLYHGLCNSICIYAQVRVGARPQVFYKYDSLWENPAFVKVEFDVSDKLYPRANPPASLRPITRFTLAIARFVSDCATRIENEKLRSEGIAMYTYGVSVYYA